MKKTYLFVGLLFIITGFLTFVFLKYKNDNLGTEIVQPPELVTSQQFILMGDVGSASPQQFEVAEAIEEKCNVVGNCQAVFILGDIIYEEGISSAQDPQLQRKLIEPYEHINLPFYLALGNHDYLNCATECYVEFANNNPKWHFPDRYYVQDFESISFIVIDTENFDVEQQQWLTDQLARSTKKWKVVLGHRPIISEENTKKGENWSGKQELRDIVCQSADYYISGHAHLLEDRGKLSDCKTHHLISGAGGSYVRKIAEPFTGEFYAEENGFLTLISKGDELQFEFIDDDGEVLHQQ
jgi:tartrate-resistant acid phosphatase type 5